MMKRVSSAPTINSFYPQMSTIDGNGGTNKVSTEASTLIRQNTRLLNTETRNDTDLLPELTERVQLHAATKRQYLRRAETHPDREDALPRAVLSEMPCL